MKQTFQEPDFSSANLEFRIDNDEVCIYGTSDGLRWLADQCLSLAESSRKQHVHLEDFHMTTEGSKPATLALFLKKINTGIS